MIRTDPLRAKTLHCGFKQDAMKLAAMNTDFRQLITGMTTARFAVHNTFVTDTQELREGDEVALIGMVSGG